MTTDVLVIGGGVIGCAVAYSAAAREFKVTLLERHFLGAGASGANNAGVTVSYPEPGPGAELLRASAGIFSTLAAELDADIEYVQAGGMRALLTENDVREAQAFAATRRAQGRRCEILDSTETLRLEPSLTPSLLGGLYTPDDGHLNPFALIKAYARRLAQLGVRIVIGAPVEQLLVSANRITGAATPKERYQAGATVLAAGAWSAQLGYGVGLNLPITPSRGQLLVTEPLASFSRRTLRYAGTLIRQLPRGTAVIGSNVEHVGFDGRVTSPPMAKYARDIERFVPGLARAGILRAFSGLRPHSPDGNPLLGPVDGLDGLVLACGHDRHGVGWSAATGHLIAQLLAGETPMLDVRPFSYERFAHRAPQMVEGIG